MATEAQTLANRRLGRRIVLNLGHFDFEIVSDFDIRISDFNHSGCFMQNKPNFQKAQMNASAVLTKDYDNWTLGERGKNKANTNPIKANFKPDYFCICIREASDNGKPSNPFFAKDL